MVVVASLSLAGCSANKPAAESAPPAEPGTAAANAPSGDESPLVGAALVLDVRTPEEHAAGHIEGDMLVPVTEIEARIAEIEAAVDGDKSKKVVTYCKSGNRAGVAKATLEAHGFTNVVNGGGYEALRASQGS